MSAFTPAGSGGITGGGGGGTGNLQSATAPTVANVAIVAANTEYNYALPDGTKRFIFKIRNLDGLATVSKLYYVSAGSTYLTIMPGAVYSETDILTTGLIIYFQCSHASRVAEIVSWV